LLIVHPGSLRVTSPNRTTGTFEARLILTATSNLLTRRVASDIAWVAGRATECLRAVAVEAPKGTFFLGGRAWPRKDKGAVYFLGEL
jgi:hypothetical protein